MSKTISRARQRGYYHRTTFTTYTKPDKQAIPWVNVFAFKIYDDMVVYDANRPALKITKFRFVVDGITDLIKFIRIQYKANPKDETAKFLHDLLEKNDEGHYDGVRVPYIRCTADGKKTIRTLLSKEEQQEVDDEKGHDTLVLRDGAMLSASFNNKAASVGTHMAYIQLTNIRSERPKNFKEGKGNIFYMQVSGYEKKPAPSILKSLKSLLPKDQYKTIIKDVKSYFANPYFKTIKDEQSKLFQLMKQLAFYDKTRKKYTYDEFLDDGDKRKIDNYTFLADKKSQVYVPIMTYYDIRSYDSSGDKEQQPTPEEIPSIPYLIEKYRNGTSREDWYPEDYHQFKTKNYVFLKKDKKTKDGTDDGDNVEKKAKKVDETTVNQRYNFVLTTEIKDDNRDLAIDVMGSIYENLTVPMCGITQRIVFESIMTLNKWNLAFNCYCDKTKTKNLKSFTEKAYTNQQLNTEDQEYGVSGDEGEDNTDIPMSQAPMDDIIMEESQSNFDAEIQVGVTSAVSDFYLYLMEYGLKVCDKDDPFFMIELMSISQDILKLEAALTSKEKIETLVNDYSDGALKLFTIGYHNKTTVDYIKKYKLSMRYKKYADNPFNTDVKCPIKNINESHGTYRFHKNKHNEYRILVGFKDVVKQTNIEKSLNQLGFIELINNNNLLTTQMGNMSDKDKMAIMFLNRQFIRRCLRAKLRSIGKNETSFAKMRIELSDMINKFNEVDYDNVMDHLDDEQVEKYKIQQMDLNKEYYESILECFEFVSYVVKNFHKETIQMVKKKDVVTVPKVNNVDKKKNEKVPLKKDEKVRKIEKVVSDVSDGEKKRKKKKKKHKKTKQNVKN